MGAAEIISRIVDDLKDEAEQYRKMVMETIEKIMGNLGAADIDHKLEEQLIDGILYAFQEQTTEVSRVRVGAPMFEKLKTRLIIRSENGGMKCIVGLN